jgi:hypothetical protein
VRIVFGECVQDSIKMSSSKRRDLSLTEKMNLLKMYDNLPKMSQRDAATALKISQPLLCKLLQKRHEIEGARIDNSCSTRKRKRTGKDADVEEALKQWFTNVRSKDARVDGPLLMAKAEDLAKRMGKENFSATNGWFYRWQKRENITYKKTCGEQGEADYCGAESWLREVWPSLIAEYTPQDVYNADETGLYFRALPEHTYAFKHEKASGVKICKERITVLCCANMAGMKEELVIIGKSQKPRCFKNVKCLPLPYTANKNAWMTTSIFSEWLRKWDAKLDRKILLLVDNCTAHCTTLQLKNIKVVFLPSNTTSLIQPCDQGIIRTMKGYYRHEMRRRVLQHLDEAIANGITEIRSNDIARKTSVLDALHLLKQSWQSVSEAVIRSSFKKGGFMTCDSDEETLESPPVPEDMSVDEYNEWMAIDENVETSGQLCEDDICSTIMKQDGENQTNGENEDDDDDTNCFDPPPSNIEMLRALDILRRGVQTYSDNFDLQYKYEEYIKRIVCNNTVQSTINHFFTSKKDN